MHTGVHALRDVQDREARRGGSSKHAYTALACNALQL